MAKKISQLSAIKTTTSADVIPIVQAGSTYKIALDYLGVVPVGTVVAWLGGYFQDGSNGTYTRVLGTANTVAAANTYLPSGWRVCNGAALNDADSAIFNGADRYLPNVTDDRFLMGDTESGGIGGANTQTHSVTSNVAVEDHAAHTHSVTSNVSVGNHATHTHARGSYFACVVPDDGNEYVYHKTESTPGWTSSYRTSGVTVAANSTAWSYGVPVSGTSATESATLTHSVTNNAVTSGDPSATLTHSVTNNAVTSGSSDNRPVWLSVFYIMRVH